MCDYSLHGVASRPAKVGDKLITSRFWNTGTRGFSALSEANVAVCLLPGTEIAFEAEVCRRRCGFRMFARSDTLTIHHKVGRFRQINMDDPATHHDAIEFPDGQTILLTQLRTGQRATVLQLPVRACGAPESDGNVPAAAGRSRAHQTV